MSLICLASQKGAPGATLTALALAASWPTGGGRRVALVEADPAGGVLAIRYGLGVEPGLVSLAAVVRAGRHRGVDGVWDHAQELPGGRGAVVCPDGPEQVHSALRAAGTPVARWLAGLGGVDVIVDVGRLGPGSPARPFVAAADVVLMVARPDVEQLQPAARNLQVLAGERRPVAWVLVGARPHGPVEVEDVYGFDVAGVIAHDRRGADAVEGSGTRKRIERSALMRSATSLAADLAARLHPEPPIQEGAVGSPDGDSGSGERPVEGDRSGNGATPLGRSSPGGTALHDHDPGQTGGLSDGDGEGVGRVAGWGSGEEGEVR